LAGFRLEGGDYTEISMMHTQTKEEPDLKDRMELIIADTG
jgi:hypothetical protein